MSDAGRDLVELKREIVEARNQAIKTDNQVKNLTLDIKGFEKRFDGLEGRVRLSSIGVNLIVAVTIAIAAYVVSSVRIKGYESEIASLKSVAQEDRDSAATKSDDLHGKLGDLEKRRRLHDQASEVANQVLTLLDNKQDHEAGDLLDKLDIGQLSPLERRLAEKRFADLRHREADTAYRSGKSAALSSHFEAAVPDLRRTLALDPDARTAAQARYLLATSLYAIKHYDEAEPVLRDIAKSDDKGIVEEAQYVLAGTLARLGKRDESKTLFTQLGSGNGKFSGSSKAYLSALESGGELPTDLPGGRVRVSRKPPPNPTAQASDDTASSQ